MTATRIKAGSNKRAMTSVPAFTVKLKTNIGRGDAQAVAATRSVALLTLLWKKRGSVARAIFVGATAATLLAFSLSPRFESTMRLMPPDYAGSGELGDLAGTNNSGALWIDILKSRSVQDRMIERFDLKRIYRVQLMQTVRTQLAKSTVLDEDLKSGIIAVTVTDKSAQRAAAMSNAYAEELNRVLTEQATSLARHERFFLENRLRVVKLDLDSAAKEFSDFSSKNATIDMDEQGATLMDSAAALNGQLIARKSELAGLEQIYTNGNARLREESAGVRELQTRLGRMGAKPGAELSASLPSDGSVSPSIRELPLLGVAFSDLSRNKELQEDLYENVSKLLELAKIQEVRETPTVKILDSAIVADRKSFPPRFEIMLLGIFFSAAASVSWILAQAQWQRADSQDLRRCCSGVEAELALHN